MEGAGVVVGDWVEWWSGIGWSSLGMLWVWVGGMWWVSRSTWGGGVGWMGPPGLAVSFVCVALNYAHHTYNPLASHELTKTAMGLAHCILMQHGGAWGWYPKPIGHHIGSVYTTLCDTTSPHIKCGHPNATCHLL